MAVRGYGVDGTWARPLVPASGETVNSEPFTVPGRAKSIAVHVPALTGTGATVKIQALVPAEDIENTSETWQDVTVFDLTDGTFEALDGLVESTCVVIPTSALGNTVLRFVASESQAAAPVRIPVFMNFGG